VVRLDGDVHRVADVELAVGLDLLPVLVDLGVVVDVQFHPQAHVYRGGRDTHRGDDQHGDDGEDHASVLRREPADTLQLIA